MVHAYEFELIEKEGGFLVIPRDFEGATSGETLREAYEMAADWLKLTIEHCAIHGLPLPEPTFGNDPANGGKVVIIAVDAGLHTVPRMTAAEAARALGVSPSRVSHMIRDGKLESFKHGHNTWVSRYHVEAILSSPRRPGRPKMARTVTSAINQDDFHVIQ